MTGWRAALRLVLITDGRGDAERIVTVARAAIDGGVRAVQLREPGLGARRLRELCEELRDSGALVIVNDRADVAATGVCDGVHLGGRSLAPAAVRGFLPRDALVGFSAHDADELRFAERQGADYVTLSPVLPTACKPGARALGVESARALTLDCALPVVWLGGIGVDSVGEVDAAAAGVAAMSAIMDAADPGAVAARLLSR